MARQARRRRAKLVLVSVEVVHLHRRGHPRSPRGTVILYIYTFLKRSFYRPFPRYSFASWSYFGPVFSLVSGTRTHPKLCIFSCALRGGRAHKSHCRARMFRYLLFSAHVGTRVLLYHYVTVMRRANFQSSNSRIDIVNSVGRFRSQNDRTLSTTVVHKSEFVITIVSRVTRIV